MKIVQNRRSPHPAVVGTVHSRDCLKRAQRLRPGAVDYLEIRADALADEAGRLDHLLPGLRLPLILTVRDPAEGGENRLALRTRLALCLRLLPHCALVDIELRNAGRMAQVLDAARASRTRIILSFHDFRRTPPVGRLRENARLAAGHGADIFKVATITNRPTEVAALLELLENPPLPVSAMGMGTLGMSSRLVLAQAGSVLNYGFLGKANAPGQWPAAELRRLLDACQRGTSPAPRFPL